MELLRDPVLLVVPAGGPSAVSELSGAAWASGQPGMAWDEVTRRLCREHGGFEPEIRHRTDNATVALALVARGMAVTLLPELALRDAGPGLDMHEVAGAERTIYATTRVVDAARPSTRALVDAVREAAR